MEWGAAEAKILKAVGPGGPPVPLPFLATKPELDEALQFEWNAFWLLSTDRQIGMAAGPIPWTALDRFATRHRIDDPDRFDRFCRLIAALDAAYLAVLDERAEAAKTKGGGT